MRALVPSVLAITLALSGAAAAQGALAPGRPAGVAEAQRGNGMVLVLVGVAAAAGLAVALSSGSGDGPKATTTSLPGSAASTV